jgi:hypothetical protein
MRRGERTLSKEAGAQGEGRDVREEEEWSWWKGVT